MLRLRSLNENRQAFAIICIVIFLVMIVVGGLLIWFILTNLVNIGIGLMFIVVPIFLMVVSAVLVKKFFWKGGK